MLRLRFAPLSMTGDDAHGVMLSEAKHPIPIDCRVLRGTYTNDGPLGDAFRRLECPLLLFFLVFNFQISYLAVSVIIPAKSAFGQLKRGKEEKASG